MSISIDKKIASIALQQSGFVDENGNTTNLFYASQDSHQKFLKQLEALAKKMKNNSEQS